MSFVGVLTKQLVLMPCGTAPLRDIELYIAKYRTAKNKSFPSNDVMQQSTTQSMLKYGLIEVDLNMD